MSIKIVVSINEEDVAKWREINQFLKDRKLGILDLVRDVGTIAASEYPSIDIRDFMKHLRAIQFLRPESVQLLACRPGDQGLCIADIFPEAKLDAPLVGPLPDPRSFPWAGPSPKDIVRQQIEDGSFPLSVDEFWDWDYLKEEQGVSSIGKASTVVREQALKLVDQLPDSMKTIPIVEYASEYETPCLELTWDNGRNAQCMIRVTLDDYEWFYGDEHAKETFLCAGGHGTKSIKDDELHRMVQYVDNRGYA